MRHLILSIMLVIIFSSSGYGWQEIYTTTEKTKLATVEGGAEINVVDSVNTETGDVVLDQDDILDGINHVQTANDYTDAEKTIVGNVGSHLIDVANPHTVTLEQARTAGNALSGNIDYNGNDIIDIVGVNFQSGEEITWNSTSNTIDVPTGLGSVIQVGREMLIKVYNNSGSTITNGTIVYPNGIYNNEWATIGLANADNHTTIATDYGMVTTDILNNSFGDVCWFGKARNLDTSGLAAGQKVFISGITPGAYTTTRPSFPVYPMQVGIVLVVDATNGEIFVTQKGTIRGTFAAAHNGAFRESFSFTIASNGTTITGSLDSNPTGRDLTCIFSSGLYIFDITPAATIALTVGTDTIPQTNYIYILESTKALTVSTSDWPTTEHVKIAQCYVQSAVTVQTNDALRNQNWNDHLVGTNNMGHINHMAERIRQLNMDWDSGTEVTVTDTADVITISNTAGKAYQMHLQDFSAFDTAGADHFYVVNDHTSPFTTLSDMNLIATDASGGTLANGSFSFVIWGVCNSGSEPDQLMVNAPTAGYAKNDPEYAVADPDNKAVYTIPAAFKGVGFLMARVTVVIEVDGTTWTIHETEDLRGKIPNATAGGGAGGGTGATTFLGLTDTPSAYTSEAGKVPMINTGETALEFVDPYLYEFGSLTTDHTWKGDTISATAGEALAIGDICYYKSDGKFWLADADAEATTKGMLALATATISADAVGVFLIRGLIRDDTWTWTIADTLWVSLTPGNPTATEPTVAGDFARILGYVQGADYIWFEPCQTYEAK